MLILRYSFLFFFISACRNEKPGKIESNQSDYVREKSIIKEQQPTLETKTINKDLLNGIWTESFSENSLFFIKGDTLTYVEHLDEPTAFKVVNDTLFIDLDGYTDTSKIILLNDSALELLDIHDESVLHLMRVR